MGKRMQREINALSGQILNIGATGSFEDIKQNMNKTETKLSGILQNTEGMLEKLKQE